MGKKGVDFKTAEVYIHAFLALMYDTSMSMMSQF